MKTDPFQLHGKVAIVTGSTRGIGFGIAAQLCSAGASCIISSENPQDVGDATRTLKNKSYDVMGVTCDVQNPDAQKSLVDKTLKTYGRLDILVCNAGITGNAGPIEDNDNHDYRRVFDINLHSMVTLCNAVHPTMKKQGTGSIILVSSISALRGNSTINGYALAKAGVTQLARNLAVQWGPLGIRANAISPGFIRTELSEPLLKSQTFMDRRIQMTPLRRPGEVGEIAAGVQFLASDAASFVTGHDLVIDGGTTVTDGS
ncbi:MAG: SDR family NAD(P)-dependent oxidoreductase [Gammaproteobacteria bacterium]